MSKLSQQISLAKSMGYTHIASVVKSVYNTNYYNAQSITDLVRARKWIGCAKGVGKYKRGVGLRYNELPSLTVMRSMLNSMLARKMLVVASGELTTFGQLLDGSSVELINDKIAAGKLQFIK